MSQLYQENMYSTIPVRMFTRFNCIFVFEVCDGRQRFELVASIDIGHFLNCHTVHFGRCVCEFIEFRRTEMLIGRSRRKRM